MVRSGFERVLLIGDTDRRVQGALAAGVPGAQVTSVAGVFDGIAELTANAYSAVLVAAEPIERRPEAAVRTLRELAGDGRLVLFGHPTLELLSRKMMQFGCDDYVITPAAPGELQQIFGTPPPPAMRLAEPPPDAGDADAAADAGPVGPSQAVRALATVPLAEVMLEAQLQSPHDAVGGAVRLINSHVQAAAQLLFQKPAGPTPVLAEGDASVILSQAVRSGAEDVGTLHLVIPPEPDEIAARHALAQLAHLVGKLAGLQDRHNRLQQMAITDELTGLYNGRYFRHFLSRIIDKARTMHFPVTLLLFDIDDFKKYNDLYGHGVGDEILRQTAKLMKVCSRQHDLVARIGGDEFAVVFWDKEGPRQPRDPKGPVLPSRPPQTPVQIFRRFQQMVNSDAFTALGSTGKGFLGISAGLAVYPYEAQDANGLIKEADKKLMFGAKQSGKNRLTIVGGGDEGISSQPS
jgi:two-component system cell cycle response regulator